MSATLTRRLVESFGRRSQIEVLGSEDLRALIELAAEQQTLGCDEEAAACLTEIGDALGARFVVTSRLGQVGSTVTLQSSVLDVDKAVPVARMSVDGSDIDAVGRQVAYLVGELEGPILEVARRSAAPDGGGAVERPKVLVLDVEVDPTLFELNAEGFSWPLVMLLQAGIALPLAVVMATPILSVCTIFIGPFVVAALQAAVGDFVGRERGPIAWSGLYAFLVSFFLGGCPNLVCAGMTVGLVGLVVAAAFTIAEEQGIDASTPEGAQAAVAATGIVPSVQAMFTISFLGGTMWLTFVNVLAYASAPIFYQWFAEPKRRGDTGGGLPGFFEPAHQETRAMITRPPARPSSTIAMRY